MRTANENSIITQNKKYSSNIATTLFDGLLSMNEVAPEVQTEEARLAELRIAYSLRPGFAITKNIQS